MSGAMLEQASGVLICLICNVKGCRLFWGFGRMCSSWGLLLRDEMLERLERDALEDCPCKGFEACSITRFGVSTRDW